MILYNIIYFPVQATEKLRSKLARSTFSAQILVSKPTQGTRIPGGIVKSRSKAKNI